MGLNVQPEPLAVLCIGLWHWVQLNDGPNCTSRTSGAQWVRRLLACRISLDEMKKIEPYRCLESNANCPTPRSLYWATHNDVTVLYTLRCSHIDWAKRELCKRKQKITTDLCLIFRDKHPERPTWQGLGKNSVKVQLCLCLIQHRLIWWNWGMAPRILNFGTSCAVSFTCAPSVFPAKKTTSPPPPAHCIWG
jgi:hypothetical protein